MRKFSLIFTAIVFVVPFFAHAAACVPSSSTSNSATFSSPTSGCTYTIPSYGTLTAEVWGGGGAGGALLDGGGGPGGQSSFNGNIIAAGGYGAQAATNGLAGAGGPASQGYASSPGNSGANGTANYCGNISPVISGAGGASPNGGAGVAGVVPQSWGNTGYSPGGGGSGAARLIVLPPGGSPSGFRTFCFLSGGGGGGAYSQKTYAAGVLTPSFQVNIVVGSGGTGAAGAGPGAPGQVKITWTAAPPPLPTAAITLPAAAYVGQPFTVSSTFTAGSGDTLAEDNIDSPLGTGLGADTNAISPKIISYSTSTPGTVTFYARARTDNYAWATYDTQSINVTLPAAPTATLTVNGGTHYTNQPLTITAHFSTSTGDTLVEDNIDAATGNPAGPSGGLGDTTNPDLTKVVTFTPTAAGTYTFNARAHSTAYPSWATYQTLQVTVISSCVPSYSCTDSTHVHNSCTGVDTACSSGLICSSGSSICVNPPSPAYTPTGSLTGYLQAIPGIVHAGDAVKLYWNISNVSSCSVTGNGQAFSGASSGSSGQTTAAITQQTIYLLSCSGLDNSHITNTATVNIVPGFQEL